MNKQFVNLCDQDTASSLCIECGLCCDGSIFSHVELSDRDSKILGIAHKSDARLNFPCEHLGGKHCSIYPNRPAICASYRCKTLHRLDEGEISSDDAHKIIRKAANLASEFEKAIPAGMTRRQAIICVVKGQCPLEASNEDFQKLRLTYVALQAMVDCHMRNGNEKVVQSAMQES